MRLHVSCCAANSSVCACLILPCLPHMSCREGELLAEAAQLQAQLQQLQAPRPAGRGPTCGGSSTEQAAQGPALSGIPSSAPPLSSMELMHRELFLAAAQQLTAEFSAKVEQVGACGTESNFGHRLYSMPLDLPAAAARGPPCRSPGSSSHCPCLVQAEQRATQLERQLAGLTVPAEQLQRQVGELRAELAAVHDQCSKEQEAAAWLLQANLRLHETVQVLAEQGMGSGSSSGICLAQVAEEAEHNKHAEMEQQRRRLAGRRPSGERPAARSGRLSAARAASGQPVQGARVSAGQQGAARRSSGHLLSRRVEMQEQLQPQKQGMQRAPAALAAPALLFSRQAATADHARVPAMQQQTDAGSAHSKQPAAARRAAVDAALALSAEHRELLAHQKVALAGLQRTASSLATAAPPAEQLVLLRRYAQLQGEVRDCCAKLEDRAVQLSALRRAGL